MGFRASPTGHRKRITAVRRVCVDKWDDPMGHCFWTSVGGLVRQTPNLAQIWVGNVSMRRPSKHPACPLLYALEPLGSNPILLAFFASSSLMGIGSGPHPVPTPTLNLSPPTQTLAPISMSPAMPLWWNSYSIRNYHEVGSSSGRCSPRGPSRERDHMKVSTKVAQLYWSPSDVATSHKHLWLHLIIDSACEGRK